MDASNCYTPSSNDFDINGTNFRNNTDGNGTTRTIIYATSLVFIMVFALVANTVAMFTILRVQSLRQTPHNLLILNLAVADLGRALIVMPLSLKSALDGGEYLRNHCVTCKAVGVLSAMLLYTNFMTIAFIAIDRVIVVTSCTKCRISDWTRVRVMITFTWVIAGAFILLPILGKSKIEYMEALKICSMNDFSELTMVVMLGIIFPTMVVSYTIIAVLLWKRNRKLTRRRRGGLRATVVTKPTRLKPSSPVGLRKVTFDMRCTEPVEQNLENNKAQTTTECRNRNGCISTPPENSTECLSQDRNRVDAESNVENCDVSFPTRRQKPEVLKRNRNCVRPVHDDGNLPTQSVSPTECVAPTRYGLGARLSLLLNIKKESVFKEEYREGEQDNCVIKGFKSAHGTGFTPGTSMNPTGTGSEDPGSITYRTVIETNTRRLSSLFGSLKGIVGLGNYGREDDDDEDDDNDSERDDEQTCDPDSEPSQTLTTYSMSPSMMDVAHGTDDDDVEGVVRTPDTRRRRRRRKRTRKSRLEKMRHMRQRRVALTGVLLVCCNIFFTLPLTVWAFLGSPQDVSGIVAYWLTYCISIADPMVYAFMNRRVKKELRMYRKVIANRLLCRE